MQVLYQVLSEWLCLPLIIQIELMCKSGILIGPNAWINKDNPYIRLTLLIHAFISPRNNIILLYSSEIRVQSV